MMIAAVAVHKVSGTKKVLQELQNILDTNPQAVAVGIDYINASINKALSCANSLLYQPKKLASVASNSYFETRMKFSPRLQRQPRFVQTTKIRKGSKREPMLM